MDGGRGIPVSMHIYVHDRFVIVMGLRGLRGLRFGSVDVHLDALLHYEPPDLYVLDYWINDYSTLVPTNLLLICHACLLNFFH